MTSIKQILGASFILTCLLFALFVGLGLEYPHNRARLLGNAVPMGLLCLSGVFHIINLKHRPFRYRTTAGMGSAVTGTVYSGYWEARDNLTQNDYTLYLLWSALRWICIGIAIGMWI